MSRIHFEKFRAAWQRSLIETPGGLFPSDSAWAKSRCERTTTDRGFDASRRVSPFPPTAAAIKYLTISLGKKRRTPNQHDQADRPHPQAKTDTSATRLLRQAERPPEPVFQIKDANENLPERPRRAYRLPTTGATPARSVRADGYSSWQRPPQRLTTPPRRPLQLREAPRTVDHAHVNESSAGPLRPRRGPAEGHGAPSLRLSIRDPGRRVCPLGPIAGTS